MHSLNVGTSVSLQLNRHQARLWLTSTCWRWNFCRIKDAKISCPLGPQDLSNSTSILLGHIPTPTSQLDWSVGKQREKLAEDELNCHFGDLSFAETARGAPKLNNGSIGSGRLHYPVRVVWILKWVERIEHSLKSEQSNGPYVSRCRSSRD